MTTYQLDPTPALMTASTPDAAMSMPEVLRPESVFAQVSAVDVSIKLYVRTLNPTPAYVRAYTALVSLKAELDVPFPPIRPTTRNYNAPKMVISEVTTMAKLVSRRIVASKPAGGRLDFSFENIPSAQGEQIRALDRRVKRDFYGLRLPDELLAGMSDGVKAEIRQERHGLRWKFAQAPSINYADMPGYCNVTVSMKTVARPIEP
jgi:hypothetical protein